MSVSAKLVYDSIVVRNYPVVTGAVLVTTVFFVLVNVVADILVGALELSVIIGALFGFAPALLGPDHRALHDRLAHTRVVKA